jgi:hypothetical protein
MRDNWLSNRVFKSYDDLVDHCCEAWNKLVDQPSAANRVTVPWDARSVIPRTEEPMTFSTPYFSQRAHVTGRGVAGQQCGRSKISAMTACLRLLQVGLVCLLATSAPAELSAQPENYPTGPVKFITQLAAGGGTDPAMRIVIEELGKMWGQQTTLVKPGAGGAIAARAAAAAPPDEYTMYMAIASTFTSLPEIQPNLPFNVNDFVPISFVGEAPMAIAVSPSLPVNSLAELIAYSKTQPGGLNLAIPNRGGIPHQAAELFRERSGAELTYVYYPGSAQAMSDVVSVG